MPDDYLFISCFYKVKKILQINPIKKAKRYSMCTRKDLLSTFKNRLSSTFIGKKGTKKMFLS